MFIEIKNLASIVEYRFDLGSTGIIEFIGENSNGKSIVAEAINFIVKDHIRIAKKRESFINDFVMSGSFLFVKDDDTALEVIISRERNGCFIHYYDNYSSGSPSISRSLREGEWDFILQKFGFKIYNEGNVCLQLCNTFGTLPFVNESYKSNFELIDAITKDRVSQAFLDNFKEVTHPKFKAKSDNLKAEANNIEYELDKLQYYDLDKLREDHERIQNLIRFGNYLDYLYFDHLEVVKSVDFDDIEPIEFEHLDVKIPVVLPLKFKGLSTMLMELETILNGRCPTCGQVLPEDIDMPE